MTLLYSSLSYWSSSRALLYVAHGVGEHMGRYEKLGQLLAENGILMYGHDHGKDYIVHMHIGNQ